MIWNWKKSGELHISPLKPFTNDVKMGQAVIGRLITATARHQMPEYTAFWEVK